MDGFICPANHNMTVPDPVELVLSKLGIGLDAPLPRLD